MLNHLVYNDRTLTTRIPLIKSISCTPSKKNHNIVSFSSEMHKIFPDRHRLVVSPVKQIEGLKETYFSSNYKMNSGH